VPSTRFSFWGHHTAADGTDLVGGKARPLQVSFGREKPIRRAMACARGARGRGRGARAGWGVTCLLCFACARCECMEGLRCDAALFDVLANERAC
jgi:hypothetical protein